MDEKLYKRAKSKVHRPLDHVINIYGWNLDSTQCFGRAGGVARSDWGGHQCQKKPKYHIGKLQFCTIHAKEVSPTLEGLEVITEPLWKNKVLRVNRKAFENDDETD